MLKGERVALRALEPADAVVMSRWYADHEFSVLDGNIYPSSQAQTEAFVRSLASPAFGDVSLGIDDEEGALIGLVRLKRGEAEDRRAELGIAIERARWSKGYGTDVVRTLLAFAFDEMGLQRVSLGVREENVRARRCYEKCGFREEGRLRKARYRDGEWRDEIVMGILDREFREREAKSGAR